MRPARSDEPLTEQCSNCGTPISHIDHTVHWTLCAICFAEDYHRYLNANRNRIERGRPGRRPPPKRR